MPRMPLVPRATGVATLLFALGCGGASAESSSESTPAEGAAAMAAAPQPLARVVCDPNGAELRTGPASDPEAVVLGYVNHRVPLVVRERSGGLARVDVRLGLPLEGLYVAESSVGAYVTRGARVRGIPVSVRPGDVVCIRDENAEPGRARDLRRDPSVAGVAMDQRPTGDRRRDADLGRDLSPRGARRLAAGGGVRLAGAHASLRRGSRGRAPGRTGGRDRRPRKWGAGRRERRQG